MKSVAPLLESALDSAEIVRSYKPRDIETFLGSMMVRDAICLRLQEMGEFISSIRRTFPEFYSREKSADWDRLIAFRNIVAHGYRTVDMRIVWEIIDVHLPRLVDELETALQVVEPDATN